jgi:hypothetical protein
MNHRTLTIIPIIPVASTQQMSCINLIDLCDDGEYHQVKCPSGIDQVGILVLLLNCLEN